jgi:hypothetical protein
MRALSPVLDKPVKGQGDPLLGSRMNSGRGLIAMPGIPWRSITASVVNVCAPCAPVTARRDPNAALRSKSPSSLLT